MRIGILGGTFDPPHIGHLRLAEAALDQLALDEVIMMPANRNPQKEAPKTPARHRLAMTRLVASGNAKLAVSDLEITRGGPSYAVDTLSELRMAQPADYWFLVGADALKGLPDWKQPQRLVRLCRLGVALRGSVIEAQALASVPKDYQPYMDMIKMEKVDISGTELRDRLAKGIPTAPWIEPQVLEYIRENELYGS